jgi:hypothetical protein
MSQNASEKPGPERPHGKHREHQRRLARLLITGHRHQAPVEAASTEDGTDALGLALAEIDRRFPLIDLDPITDPRQAYESSPLPPPIGGFERFLKMCPGAVVIMPNVARELSYTAEGVKEGDTRLLGACLSGDRGELAVCAVFTNSQGEGSVSLGRYDTAHDEAGLVDTQRITAINNVEGLRPASVIIFAPAERVTAGDTSALRVSDDTFERIEKYAQAIGIDLDGPDAPLAIQPYEVVSAREAVYNPRIVNAGSVLIEHKNAAAEGQARIGISFGDEAFRRLPGRW